MFQRINWKLFFIVLIAGGILDYSVQSLLMKYNASNQQEVEFIANSVWTIAVLIALRRSKKD